MRTNYRITFLSHFSQQLPARRLSDFIDNRWKGERVSCVRMSWVKRKEPEIVAQMNLKYCHSTSLHLSPVGRRSSRFSIILPFVLSLAEQLNQVRSFSSLVVFFLPSSRSRFRSFLFRRKSLSRAAGWIDAPSRIFELSDRTNSPGTTINRSEWRITIRLSIVTLSSVDVDRTICFVSQNWLWNREIGNSCSSSIIESMLQFSRNCNFNDKTYF